MLNWLRKNFLVVLLVTSCVALSLIVVPFYNSVDTIMNFPDDVTDSYRTYMIINMFGYLCLAVSEIIFIVMSSRKGLDKKYIILALVIFFLADISLPIYRLIVNQAYSSIYTIIIKLLVIVFMILSLSDRRFFLVTLIVLLIDAAPTLLGVFVGSQVDFSKLLLDFMLLFSIYFYIGSTPIEQNDTYYQ